MGLEGEAAFQNIPSNFWKTQEKLRTTESYMKCTA